jgi:hypothetical protein
MFSTSATFAQTDKSQRKSPPVVVTGAISGIDVTLDYSSPAVKGRDLWGTLVAYDKVWRTGANEATKITIGKDALVQGSVLAAGTYSLFTIPGEKTWTVIFNKEANQWGNYDYNASEDALRVSATPSSSDTFSEDLTFEIGTKTIDFKWGNLVLPIMISNVIE